MKTGYIPQEILDEIQSRSDIVSVIGEYVPLKRAGANYTGLCPFHNEKTPSFSVSPNKQIFYCFGCGVGGNVFKFLMLIENLTFREAAEKLAARAGISLPEKELSPAEKATMARRERLFKINDVTARYYQKVLWESEAGKPYLAYLRNRGLSDEIIKKFGLGAAIEGWDHLSKFLKTKGITDEEMIDLGLALPRKERDGCYDRFRGRVMFPIRDEKGRTIAFGGRVIDPAVKQQKYMNSPDTPLFHKGKNLYGLDIAKSAIRSEDGVILVEGYMDVISCHQFGIKNVVAPLGTAFTEEQAKMLMKNTYRVYVSFDGDTAGVKAAMRSLNILNDLGCNVRVLTIPDGRDPDEYLKEYGPEAFRRILARSREYLVYKTDMLLESTNSSDISGKAKIVAELVPDLRKLSSAVALDSAADMIAEKLQLSKKAILAEVRGQKGIVRKDISENQEPSKEIVMDANALAKKKNNKQYMAEAQMLASIYRNAALFDEIEAYGGKDLFQTELAQLYEQYKVEGKFSAADDLLTGILMLSEEESSTFQERLMFLRKVNCEKRYEAVLKEIQTNEKMGATNNMLNLLQELEQIRKEKEQLTLGRGTR